MQDTQFRGRGLLVVAVAIAMVMLGSVPVQAEPAASGFPDDNGLIAFQKHGQLWTAHEDGGDAVSLGSGFAEPAWSPDGTTLAVSYGPDLPGAFEPQIWLMDARGDNARSISESADAGDRSPSWSADGSRIAFIAWSTTPGDSRHDLWVMNADGTGRMNVTESVGSSEIDPAWSPDGKWIAYCAYAEGDPASALWLIDPDTSPPVRVRLSGPDSYGCGSPSWSPDGRQIVFSVLDAIGVYTVLHVMNADGTGETELSGTGSDHKTHPAWSPDGTRIAYVEMYDPGSELEGGAIIAVMNTDGSGRVVLHGDEADPGGTYVVEPAWQPLPGTHPIGMVNPSSGEWHLRHDGQVESFFYGNPGDYPLMGDWDCDGEATPALYRQSDGYVYLRNANTQGVADVRYYFGNPGDVPLAGDFDGDGCDTVSLYRPGETRFYIINQLGSEDAGLGAAEVDYVFGNPGDKPFIGDFDGDGVDTVGLHRESTGVVYFRNSHTEGNADSEFVFGNPDDRLITGDWNEDGLDTVAVFRPADERFYFHNTNTQGRADAVLVWGTGSWLPVAGEFSLD